MNSLATLLEGLPICAGMTRDECRRLADALSPFTVERGDAVFKEGTTSDAMFFLASGTVEVRLLAQEHPIATLRAPSVFGEMGVLTSSPHCATVIAASSVQLYALSAQRFDDFVGTSDSVAFKLGLNLAKLLATRLREVDAQLAGRSEPESEVVASVRQRLLRDWSY